MHPEADTTSPVGQMNCRCIRSHRSQRRLLPRKTALHEYAASQQQVICSKSLLKYSVCLRARLQPCHKRFVCRAALAAEVRLSPCALVFQQTPECWFDHNRPHKLRRSLPAHKVKTADEMVMVAFGNEASLTSAEIDGFGSSLNRETSYPLACQPEIRYIPLSSKHFRVAHKLPQALNWT